MIEMAAFNSTETPTLSGFAGFPVNLLSMPELEKISCSIKGKIQVHPLQLMGKRIRYAEVLQVEVGIDEGDALESFISSGTVLAVHLGSIEQGIETSLLIQQDGFDFSDYSNVSNLTVLEVFD
jgi:hypothetical protein